MRVSAMMTAFVGSVRATDSIAYAARRMAEMDVRALPVASDGERAGIATDRDIDGCGSGGEVARRSTQDDERQGGNAAGRTAERSSHSSRSSRSGAFPPPTTEGSSARSRLRTAPRVHRDKQDAGDTIAEIREPGGIHSQTGHLVERSFEEMMI